MATDEEIESSKGTGICISTTGTLNGTIGWINKKKGTTNTQQHVILQTGDGLKMTRVHQKSICPFDHSPAYSMVDAVLQQPKFVSKMHSFAWSLVGFGFDIAEDAQIIQHFIAVCMEKKQKFHTLRMPFTPVEWIDRDTQKKISNLRTFTADVEDEDL